MVFREYVPTDCKALAELFYDTVHTVNAGDYSREQLDAWADGTVDLMEWNRSFLSHFTMVAVDDNIITGFGDIDKMGYLDRLYVHRDYQRQGIAGGICDRLEKAFDVEKIITHASITAMPFFEKRGYRVLKARQVLRGGIRLTNYVMELSLTTIITSALAL